MVLLAMRDDGDDKRRAKRRVAGFVDGFFILTVGDGGIFQQRAEALAPFTFDNKETPRLERAVIRGAQPARRTFSSASPVGAGSASREALRRLTSISNASISTLL